MAALSATRTFTAEKTVLTKSSSCVLDSISTTREEPCQAVPFPRCLYISNFLRPHETTAQNRPQDLLREGLSKVWIKRLQIINYLSQALQECPPFQRTLKAKPPPQALSRRHGGRQCLLCLWRPDERGYFCLSLFSPQEQGNLRALGRRLSPEVYEAHPHGLSAARATQRWAQPISTRFWLQLGSPNPFVFPLLLVVEEGVQESTSRIFAFHTRK